MDIEFKTKKLAKACSSEAKMKKQWGGEMAKKLRQRLADLEAAATLEVMLKLPGRCHELRDNLVGHLALDLKQPYRLIFCPNHDPRPVKEDGGLDWSRVTKVLITDVTDYH